MKNWSVIYKVCLFVGNQTSPFFKLDIVHCVCGPFQCLLKLLREGACFNEDGSRFHANGPLYLKVVLPLSKLNLGDIKELVFRKLSARELVLGLKRPIILSEVRLYWTLYIS